MKKILLFFLALTVGFFVHGQPIVKIFAFEQDNLPGTKAVGVKDENGKALKKAAAGKKYFIYMSYGKKYALTPIQAFIRGQAFAVKKTIVKKSPVEFINNTVINNPQKTLLVPATKDKVVELAVADFPVQQKLTAYTKSVAEKNDVVIAYLWNKKKYFVSLQKLNKLEPMANE